jgi:hypothetical protein
MALIVENRKRRAQLLLADRAFERKERPALAALCAARIGIDVTSAMTALQNGHKRFPYLQLQKIELFKSTPRSAHDGGKTVGFQARAAHQSAVYVFQTQQLRCVFRLTLPPY